jgi:hypothetical protein
MNGLHKGMNGENIRNRKYVGKFKYLKCISLLSFAGKWMELENIILSEVSLAQKTKNHMFSLICGH